MNYYIVKNEIRPDGIINNAVVGRQSFGSGLAEYYSQCSKAPMSTTFTSVHIALLDEELNVVKKEDIETMYVAEGGGE